MGDAWSDKKGRGPVNGGVEYNWKGGSQTIEDVWVLYDRKPEHHARSLGILAMHSAMHSTSVDAGTMELWYLRFTKMTGASLRVYKLLLKFIGRSGG